MPSQESQESNVAAEPMTAEVGGLESTLSEEEVLAAIGHPKGTLAIVLIYMLLFVVGWIGMYVFTFLPRGTPDAEPMSSPTAAEYPLPSALEDEP